VAVSKAKLEPEAVELGAAAAAELGAAAAVGVAAGPTVVDVAADDPLEELLQAASSIAAPASGRPTLSARSEVLRTMMILPRWCGPIIGPHVMTPCSVRSRVPDGLNTHPRQKSLQELVN
jgi:hypothetical protein